MIVDDLISVLNSDTLVTVQSNNEQDDTDSFVKFWSDDYKNDDNNFYSDVKNLVVKSLEITIDGIIIFV